jgi:hypothetical protein
MSEFEIKGEEPLSFSNLSFSPFSFSFNLSFSSFDSDMPPLEFVPPPTLPTTAPVRNVLTDAFSGSSDTLQTLQLLGGLHFSAS